MQKYYQVNVAFQKYGIWLKLNKVTYTNTSRINLLTKDCYDTVHKLANRGDIAIEYEESSVLNDSG